MRSARPERTALFLAWVFGACSAASADWKLEHEEDFSRVQALDTSYWSYEGGFQRNREEQYYTAANVAVRGGRLVIEGRREEVPNAAYQAGAPDWRRSRPSAAFTSGSIVARRPLHFGRVEVVARTPSGAGMWPAVWLLHESPGTYGEIDILEAVGKHPDTLFAGVHHGRQPATRRHSNASRHIPGFEGRWHTHTVEWTPDRITVAVDGEVFFRFDPREAATPGSDPLRQPMRLRINLALGGSWGGPLDAARLPARLEIASVRVWRWAPGAGDGPLPPPRIPADGAADDVPAAALPARGAAVVPPAAGPSVGIPAGGGSAAGAPNQPAAAPAAPRWGR